MSLHLRELRIDKETGLKYWFDSMEQQRYDDGVVGSGLLSSLISKLASSSTGKKVASIVTSKAMKDLAVKGIKNVIDKGSSEAGSALGKLASSEIENAIKKRRYNNNDIKKLILKHPQNKTYRTKVGKEFDKLI